MIVTVTANPSIDRTLHVGSFERGGVNRAVREGVEPSGKGVNVSLALHASHVPTLAVLPVGGASGAHLVSMLDDAGLPHRDVPVSGGVRTNVTVVEPDGTTTKVNERGPELTPAEADALLAAASGAGEPDGWTAWCGSLPGGFDAERLCAAVADARSRGALVAVDTSEATLAAVVAAPRDRLPHLVKPNAHELAELTGRPLRTLGDVADAATGLVDSGVRTVLVSLGADGALLVEDGVALHGAAPVPRVVNTVGAGDAFLAGYLAAQHSGHCGALGALERALRYAAAAVQQQGTLVRGPDDAVTVVLQDCERDRELREPAGTA